MPRPEYTAEQLCALYDEKHALMGNLLNRFERIARYADPANAGFNTDFAEGSNVYADKRDATMSQAGWRMARAFNTLLTDSSTKWFALRFKDNEINENNNAKAWLDEATEIYHDELQDSNFAEEIYEAWAAYVFYNNCCIDVRKKDGKSEEGSTWTGLNFKNRHVGSVVILDDINGKPGMMALRYELNALQAFEEFGDDVSDKVKEDVQQGKLANKHSFLHVVYKRDVRDIDDMNVKIKPEKMPWASVYIELKPKTMVRKSGTMEQSRVYARYQTMNGSDYGTGPGHEAIDEAELLSRAREMTFDEWEKSIGSPLVTEVGNVLGNIRVGADEVTVVTRIDGIKELRTSRDKGYERFKFEESRQQIKDIFLWDHLDLPKREDVGQMTATEIIKRLEKAFQALGPVTGRASRELLTLLLMSGFNRMMRAGRLPPFPDELKGEKLYIKFIGPLARAQQMAEIESSERAQMELLEKVRAGAPEDLVDNVDWDEAERKKYRALGVPASLIRSRDDVKKLRAERMEAIRAQEQAELEKTNASALKDASAAGVDINKVIPMEQQGNG